MKEKLPVDWHRYENAARAKGFKAICGVDEAGRGPLAGPVCAAAVILPPDCVIKDKALAYSIAMASEKEIDEINILQATFLAMKRAVDSLSIKPDYILVDGNRDPLFGTETELVVKGDSLSASIAAASVLAKVTRDRFMLEIDKKYPQYQFSKHKGYGTKLHYEMIAEYGISDVHRRTFLKKLTGEK